MQEYFVYFKFFKRKDRDKRFGEGRRRSRQGFFYSRRDGPAPLEAATRIGIPIESGWYRVIYAPDCASRSQGRFCIFPQQLQGRCPRRSASLPLRGRCPSAHTGADEGGFKCGLQFVLFLIRKRTGETAQNPFLFPCWKKNGFWNPKKKGLPCGLSGPK